MMTYNFCNGLVTSRTLFPRVSGDLSLILKFPIIRKGITVSNDGPHYKEFPFPAVIECKRSVMNSASVLESVANNSYVTYNYPIAIGEQCITLASFVKMMPSFNSYKHPIDRFTIKGNTFYAGCGLLLDEHMNLLMMGANLVRIQTDQDFPPAESQSPIIFQTGLALLVDYTVLWTETKMAKFLRREVLPKVASSYVELVPYDFYDSVVKTSPSANLDADLKSFLGTGGGSWCSVWKLVNNGESQQLERVVAAIPDSNTEE